MSLKSVVWGLAMGLGVRGLSEVASHSGGLEVDCTQAFIEQPDAKQMS